jgi:DnaJ-class molecular chaperone
MSTCSECQGTGCVLRDEQPGVTDEPCLLCRGSGSRVPHDLSNDPELAAQQLDRMAGEFDEADEASPYKRGYLGDSIHQAATLLRSLAGGGRG